MVGLNSAVMGLAAVGGSLVAAAVAHRMRRRVVFFVAFLVAGPPRYLVLAMDAPVWVMLVVFAVSGLGGGLINPILGAISFSGCRVGSWGGSTRWETRWPSLGFHWAGSWPARRWPPPDCHRCCSRAGRPTSSPSG